MAIHPGPVVTTFEFVDQRADQHLGQDDAPKHHRQALYRQRDQDQQHDRRKLGLDDRVGGSLDDAPLGVRDRVPIEPVVAGLDDGANAAQTIMALETRLAEENLTKEKLRDYANNYRKYPIDDLSELMPNFNWDGWTEELGIQDLDEVVVFTSDYMKALDNIITDTDLDTFTVNAEYLPEPDSITLTVDPTTVSADRASGRSG